jgi:hypothetical protein
MIISYQIIMNLKYHIKKTNLVNNIQKLNVNKIFKNL